MTDIDLPDFLLARIAEDEIEARKWVHHAQQNDLIVRDPKYLGMFMPGWHQWREIETFAAHVLAECSAKRQIIEQILSNRVQSDGQILKMLARPYVDHPDYQWKWQR